MSHETHTHARTNDAVIPPWMKTARMVVGWCVGIFLAGDFTVTWFDGHFAKASDIERKADKAEVVAEFKAVNEKLDSIKEDLRDLKRATVYHRDGR